MSQHIFPKKLGIALNSFFIDLICLLSLFVFASCYSLVKVCFLTSIGGLRTPFFNDFTASSLLRDPHRRFNSCKVAVEGLKLLKVFVINF